MEIITESLVIDPSSFPPVELPHPTRAQPPRAANDPRARRTGAATHTQGNAALDLSARPEEAAEETEAEATLSRCRATGNGYNARRVTEGWLSGLKHRS